MNATSKADYDGAYESLKNGESAIYRQEGQGAYIDGEVVITNIDTPITCYVDRPTLQEVQSGLALIEDAKVLIAAKSMPTITPKLGEKIVFSDKTLQVKKNMPVKSLEGIVVLHQIICSAG